MSQENVETVRRASESLERRDWQAGTDLFDPDVELHGTVGGLEEGKVLRGLSEIVRAFDTEIDAPPACIKSGHLPRFEDSSRPRLADS